MVASTVLTVLKPPPPQYMYELAVKFSDAQKEVSFGHLHTGMMIKYLIILRIFSKRQ